MHRPGKEGDERNFHAHSLRAKLKGMLNGLEAEVALVVDVMLPTERLVDAIRAFEREFPTVAGGGNCGIVQASAHYPYV